MGSFHKSAVGWMKLALQAGVGWGQLVLIKNVFVFSLKYLRKRTFEKIALLIIKYILVLYWVQQGSNIFIGFCWVFGIAPTLLRFKNDHNVDETPAVPDNGVVNKTSL